MKKMLYFLCCCFSICAFVYMCYDSYIGLMSISKSVTFHHIAQILGTVGWGFITYGIVTRKFVWTEKLCK